MNCNWSIVDLGYRCGDLVSMIKEAKEVAKVLNTKVSFQYNGLKVNLTKHSETSTLVDKVVTGVEEGRLSVFGEGWS